MSDKTPYTIEIEFRDPGRRAEQTSSVTKHFFDDSGFLHVFGASLNTKFRLIFPADVIHAVKAWEEV